MKNDIKTRIEACILDSNYPDEFVEMAIKQLDELNAKAKAFDEIKKIIYYENLAWTDEGYYDGYHERIGKITEDVIDKYDNQMEDK
ncbi:hypothetical protein [Mammaliicoccus sciuri]|uniref:hypothetical protein n=1 Tax=Mammaliicoccus sciuri TaxID=1296 RepID=UPI003A91F7EE